jgi:hypothetical protein
MIHRRGRWIYSIFVCIIGICIISTNAGADYSLTLSDVSMRMDINNLETLRLGDIPQEIIIGSVLILNEGNEVSPPFNILFSLVSYPDKEHTVDLISRPGGVINPGSSGKVYLTTQRTEMLTPGRYYLKASLVIDNLVVDSLISSEFGSLGGGTRDPSIIPVYKGYKITKPGYYSLQQNIVARDNSAVFEITCEDVTLDGNGFSISGPAGARRETNGVIVTTGMNKPLRRVTIKNLNIASFSNGIWLFDINDAKVLNTHISQASKFGIKLDRVRSSTFSENIIENCLTGIGVFKSYGNTFTNNIFKNQNNVIVNEKMGNAWSIDPVPGKNVLGGERRGGNVWLTPDGSGFSVNATDSNGDGFTDMSFAIDADNIDYHPLVYRSVFVEQRNTNDEIETTGTPEEIRPGTQERELTQDADREVDQKNIQIIPVSQNISDVLITNATGTQQICPGEEIEITAIVKNNNNENRENIDLYYYISREPTIQANSRMLGATSISFKPNEEKVVFASFKGPEGTEGYVEGKYYVGIITDPYESLADLRQEKEIYVLEERLTINSCK